MSDLFETLKKLNQEHAHFRAGQMSENEKEAMEFVVKELQKDNEDPFQEIYCPVCGEKMVSWIAKEFVIAHGKCAQCEHVSAELVADYRREARFVREKAGLARY